MHMLDKRRDADAFERAAAPYEKQIYFLCLRLTGNPHDAQDCAQDAMLRAFRAFPTFRGEAKLSTWLYTIAHRACMDALRRRRPDVSLEELAATGWEAEDVSPTPYARLEQSERKRLLEEALRRLPDDQRAALVMVDLQGLPYDEAARALGIPLGTLKSRTARARDALAAQLQTYRELFSACPRHNIGRREQ